MSVVKLHLPHYTNKILLELLEKTNYNKDMYIININNMGIKDPKQLYNELGNVIFSYPEGSKLVIIGETNNIKLPIPPTSKIILKEKNVSINKIKKYQKLGYEPFTERKILDSGLIEELIDSTYKHTGGFQGKKDVLAYNVYKLWFLTNDLQKEDMKMKDILSSMYGNDYKQKLKTHKLWDDVSISNIKSYPDHYNRLKKADLNDPILITKYNKKYKVIDGLHRLMKAYILGNNNISVKVIPKKILNQTQIN